MVLSSHCDFDRATPGGSCLSVRLGALSGPFRLSIDCCIANNMARMKPGNLLTRYASPDCGVEPQPSDQPMVGSPSSMNRAGPELQSHHQAAGQTTQAASRTSPRKMAAESRSGGRPDEGYKHRHRPSTGQRCVSNNTESIIHSAHPSSGSSSTVSSTPRQSSCQFQTHRHSSLSFRSSQQSPSCSLQVP